MRILMLLHHTELKPNKVQYVKGSEFIVPDAFGKKLIGMGKAKNITPKAAKPAKAKPEAKSRGRRPADEE